MADAAGTTRLPGSEAVSRLGPGVVAPRAEATVREVAAIVVAWTTAAAAAALLVLSLSLDGFLLGGIGTPAGVFWIVVLLGGGIAASLILMRRLEMP